MTGKNSMLGPDSARTFRREDFLGKTWVTRKGIYVDRIVKGSFEKRIEQRTIRQRGAS